MLTDKFTEEDMALARRRYEKFVELTQDLEPNTYDVENDIIPLLPLDGATIYQCGESRFVHEINEVCVNPEAYDVKCGEIVRGGPYRGETCVRIKNHTRGHSSENAMKANRERMREKWRKDNERKKSKRQGEKRKYNNVAR